MSSARTSRSRIPSASSETSSSILFLVFAAYYYKVPLESRDQALLPLMTLLSGFGSPTSAVNAVEFLSRMARSPGRDPRALRRAADAHALLPGHRFGHGVRVPERARHSGLLRQARDAVSTAGRGAGLSRARIRGHRVGRTHVQGYFPTPAGIRYGALTLDPAVTRGRSRPRCCAELRVGAGVANAARAALTIDRIQQSGALRVGYNAAAAPFSYFNDAGELVGYDVSFAYDLAHSLNVRLIFVPFEFAGLEHDLKAGTIRHRHGGHLRQHAAVDHALGFDVVLSEPRRVAHALGARPSISHPR